MKMMKGMNNKSISNYFLEKYRMRQKNCKFNRQDFLDEFKEYFEDLINKYPDKNPKTGCITYKTFNTLLYVVRNDWLKISSESAKPLSNGLWDAFFCTNCNSFEKDDVSSGSR